jgi:hypothetical protein
MTIVDAWLERNCSSIVFADARRVTGYRRALRMAFAISVSNALGFRHMTAIDRIKPFAEDKEDVHVLIHRPWVTKGAAARLTPENGPRF